MESLPQEYFSVNQEPEAPVSFWRRKKTRVAIAVVCGVFLLGLVGVYAYQSFRLAQSAKERVSDVGKAVADATAGCTGAEDVAACEAKGRTDAAVTTGSAAACSTLVGSAFTNCVRLVSRNTVDPSVCAAIDDGDIRAVCEDAAWSEKARTASDYALCSHISNDETQSDCEAQLLPIVIADDECEKYGVAQNICDASIALDAVIAAGDPKACVQLPAADRDACEDTFASVDLDADGLSRLRESKLGTSDDNADTDGDGYTDGDEIATGHDPLS